MQLIVLLLINTALGCLLNGVINNNSCVNKLDRQSEIPYCYGSIPHQFICVPDFIELWPDWTLAEKDRIIYAQVSKILSQRLLKETGQKPELKKVSFSGLKECLPAFKKFVCAMNYPPCENNTTLKVCLSYCADFHKECGIGKGDTCMVDYPQFDGRGNVQFDINC